MLGSLHLKKIKLAGSSENKIAKDKNGENVPQLEVTEVVLVHCTLVNNVCQHDPWGLYTFTPNKPFGSFNWYFTLDIYILGNLEFSHGNVWFTDQNPVIRISRQIKFDFEYFCTPIDFEILDVFSEKIKEETN